MAHIVSRYGEVRAFDKLFDLSETEWFTLVTILPWLLLTYNNSCHIQGQNQG